MNFRLASSIRQVSPGSSDFRNYCEHLKQWFLIMAFVPSPQHLAFIYLDTTEKKKKEQVAIDTERRFRSLVCEANAIIMILNSKGDISFMNDYGLSFFGYRSEELIGQSVFGPIIRLDRDKPQDIRKLFAIFKMKIKRHHRGMIESLTRQGQRVLVDWTVQECQDFTGEEARFVAVGIDAIDARKNQREVEKHLDRQRRWNLFNDGISRRLSHSELVGAARQLGIALAPPYVMGLLEIDREVKAPGAVGREAVDWQSKLDGIIEALQPWEAGAAWKTRDGIAVVRSFPDAADKMNAKLARTIAEEMTKRAVQFGAKTNGVRVGCAHSTHPMQSIAELYEQAYAALSFGPVLNAAIPVASLGRPGLFSIHCKRFAYRHGPANSWRISWGRWLQMNRSGQGGVLDTLREIVFGPFRPDEYGTTAHSPADSGFRKKGLEKILDVDLDSAEVVLNIAIALKMMSMAEKEYPHG
jgi:PAS domain S-box-containing protein